MSEFAAHMRSEKVRNTYIQILSGVSPNRSANEIATAADNLIEDLIAIWDRHHPDSRPPHPNTMIGRP